MNFTQTIKSLSSKELKQLYKELKKEKYSINLLHRLQWINEELINRGDLYI
tara:strand:- start:88 stop:240 length:153 start_codon:yes stop_codon:yes gene_type:complete